MLAMLAAAALSQAPTDAATVQPKDEVEEIVVTGTRRGRCRVQFEDRTLTNRQLAATARQWAASGAAVRIIRPAGAGYGCMAKLAFQLGEHGVRLIHFVER